MNIIEALQALKDGKKVRQKYWGKGRFVKANGDGTISDDGSRPVVLRNVYDDDWELYTEPVRITTEERKALELAKMCGFTGVYRVEFFTAHTGVVFVVDTPGKSFNCLVSNVPKWSVLQDSKWITTDDRLTIDELLKGGAE